MYASVHLNPSGPRLNIKTALAGIMILKIRRSWDRLVFIIETLVLVRHIYIGTGVSMPQSEYSGRTNSIPWLLMPWFIVSPGHQQPLDWKTTAYPSRDIISISCAISESQNNKSKCNHTAPEKKFSTTNIKELTTGCWCQVCRCNLIKRLPPLDRQHRPLVVCNGLLTRN